MQQGSYYRSYTPTAGPRSSPMSQGQIDWSQWHLGELLAYYRQYHGLDLHRCSEDLRIRVAYLEALENGQYNILPGAAHSKGFIRSYAQYLGLPVEEMLLLYKRESAFLEQEEGPLSPRVAATVLPYGLKEHDVRAPRGLSLVVSLLIVVGGFSGWFLFSQPEEDSITVAGSADLERITQKAETDLPFGTGDENSPLPLRGSADGLSVPSSIIQDNPAFLNGARDRGNLDRYGSTSLELVSAAPSDQTTEVKIIALELTWIVIKDRDGNDLASEVLQKGAEFVVPDQNNLKLSVADLDSVRVTLNEQPVTELRSLDSNGLYYSLEPADLRASITQ